MSDNNNAGENAGKAKVISKNAIKSQGAVNKDKVMAKPVAVKKESIESKPFAVPVGDNLPTPIAAAPAPIPAPASVVQAATPVAKAAATPSSVKAPAPKVAAPVPAVAAPASSEVKAPAPSAVKKVPVAAAPTSTSAPAASTGRKRAHIVVVGNEKGGTGKSTISFHLAVNFMRQGLRVATVDLDGRQGTLTRYVQNRMNFMEKNKHVKLSVPKHLQVSARNYADQAACKEDVTRLAAEIEKLAYEHDVIVIDTPGSNNHLFRAGHGYADTLITPINDSLIDFDVLAIVNSDTMAIDNPSKYAEFVWDVRKNRASSGAGSMQWVVVRNRLTHLDARNKRQVRQLIGDLSKRIGCRTVPGLGERVIYRELFLKGLTVLDIADPALEIDMSMSHVSARKELRTLIDSINLDNLVSDSPIDGAETAMRVEDEKIGSANKKVA